MAGKNVRELLRPSPHDGFHSEKAHAIFALADINQGKWGTRGKGDLILLTYEDAIELHMHGLLQDEDKSNAMRYAQMGYITIEFLDWLLTKKEDYNHWRQREQQYTLQELRSAMGIIDS